MLLAESQSRDFEGVIYVNGVVCDHYSRRSKNNIYDVFIVLCILSCYVINLF